MMLQVSEVMIFGYHLGEPVCTINLEGDVARVALTTADYDGETVVAAAWEHTTQAFAGIRDAVQELTEVPKR